MTRLETWTIRLAYTAVSITVWLALWLLVGLTLHDSTSFGAFTFIICFLGFEIHKSAVVDARVPISSEAAIRARVAELESQIADHDRGKTYLSDQLEKVRMGQPYKFEHDRLSPENDLLVKIDSIDRELEPKLKKRAKLHAELDELVQKKGYRGQT